MPISINIVATEDGHAVRVVYSKSYSAEGTEPGEILFPLTPEGHFAGAPGAFTDAVNSLVEYGANHRPALIVEEKEAAKPVGLEGAHDIDSDESDDGYDIDADDFDGGDEDED